MAVSTENIRYLLWSSRSDNRAAWVQQLAAWLGEKDLEHVTDLLGGMELSTESEQRKILTLFEDHYTEQQFQFERLVKLEKTEDDAILQENTRFLIDMLGEVKQKEFAARIGVGQVTVSRWRSGEQQPHKSNQSALISYFGLPNEIDLELDALFLYPGPISDVQRRTWLRERIERIDATTLRILFPALERLLRNS